MIPLKKGPEIEGMRRSCRSVSEILERLSALVEPGVSTGELDEAAAVMIREAGGKSPFFGYRGFPGHICVSVNEEVVHGIGGKRKLAYGDIVKLDVDKNPEVTRRYGILNIPTLGVFKDGQVVKELVGARSKSRLLDELADFI